MTARDGINPAIFDAKLMAGVRRLIPPERLRTYLHDLDRQFREIVESAAGRPDIESLAHKIVSQAGMLGLTRMSECARALEDACRSGSATEAAMAQCRGAIGDIQLYAMPAAGVPAPAAVT